MPYIASAYYDDLEVGGQVETDGRTVTEADIVNFAGVSGDFSTLHLDAEYASKVPFGQRVAHGMCILSIVSGSIVRTGLLAQTLAFYGIEDWRFLKPVTIGDTIRVSVRVDEKTEGRRGDRGIVKFFLRVLNQRQEVVQEGSWKVMLWRTPTGAAA